MAKKPVVPKLTSVDDLLADHLKKAEEHLITAVELFARKHPPRRTGNFVEKLKRHQEGVTSLFREELIRIRGPLRPPTRTIGKRKR